MAKLLCSTLEYEEIPKKYILTSDKRPVLVAPKAIIPILDFHCDLNIGEHIMEAFQNYGLLQVVNHGVETLMKETMDVIGEFFGLSDDEKTRSINVEGDDPDHVCKVYTSSCNYEKEDIHYWRNVLRHTCTPLQECIHYWPRNPPKYRETIGAYSSALEDLGSKILKHVSQGLGLEPEYFSGPLSEDTIIVTNQYPPCPNPSLTLGLPKHSDPSLITILQLDNVLGLQLFRDGQWFDVHPLPNSFLVMVGNQLEIVSNGKLKSAAHRAVTNSKKTRTSVAFFLNPSKECIVEPAHKLIQEQDNPPLFIPIKYKDFFKIHTSSSDGDPLSTLRSLKTNY